MGPAMLLPRQMTEFHGRGVNLAIISIVFNAVALFLVTSRLLTRWAMRQALAMCDYTITISVFVSVGLTITNCVAVTHGLGKLGTQLTPEDLQIALKAFWVAQILYTVTTMLTKTSIVFMYMRIFPDRKFHRIAWLVVVFVILCGIIGLAGTVDQCTPRKRIWDKMVEGTCINLVAFWYALASAHMLADFVILALPVPVVKRLNLPQRQKLGLLLVFALGGFVCITSILRMTTLKLGAKPMNSSARALDTTIWSTIEANTAIICACLPMLKAPLARLCPQLFPRGSDDTDNTACASTSMSNPCRSIQSSTTAATNNPSSHTYDNWGRLESKRKMDMMRVSAGISKPAATELQNPSTDTPASPSSEEAHSCKQKNDDDKAGKLRYDLPDAPMLDADDDNEVLSSARYQPENSSWSNSIPVPPRCPPFAHVRGGSEAQLIRDDRSPNDMV